MVNYFDFEAIRPYNQDEFLAAWSRIKDNDTFHKALSFLFDKDERIELVTDFPYFKSTRDFQLKIMHRAIRNIISKSSLGLTYSGFENIQQNQNYTYISNHRDIFLDSGILQILLVENGHDTSEITFGNNLMINQFIIDIGKVNKMFTVHRNGNRRELYDNSIRLSNYMRHAITEKKQSTWIAQRNGRTKNGHDETQIGLLKMLFASKPNDFESSFREMNIVPVSISYEFEPCDIIKVQELYASQNATYTKAPNEDLKSILAGVIEPKGKINLSIGQPVNIALSEISKSSDCFKALAHYLDSEIYSHFKIFPTHKIAFDILHPNSTKQLVYTKAEKEFFIDYMEQKLNYLQGDKAVLKKMFLEIYSSPVVNALAHQKLKMAN
jgi:hypothetical protein